MKARSREITIAEPCTQSWEQMQQHNGHNFCDACQKCVIDFTGYTNEAILQAITTSKTEICGRLFQTQLNQINYALIAAPANRSWMKYLGVLAIGVSVFAQDVQAATIKNNIELSNVSLKSADDKPSKLKVIYGYVLDGDNKPLKGLRVTLLNTKLFAITDENGKYTIKIDANTDLRNRLLMITTMNYGGELKINAAKEKQANFVIEKRKSVIMGLIAIKSKP